MTARSGVRRIHVLGGGLWQLPTIRLAKELGYRVLVTDMYPDAPGYAYADDHEAIDIRDRAQTLEAAKHYAIDGILCDTTDVGVPTAAFVAEQLGLPGIGYDTALRFTDKALMREVTRAAGIDNPPFVRVRASGSLREAEALGFPLVVKPVDSQSSRGVRRVENRAELEAAVTAALAQSASGSAIVEGFLEGIEVTVEAMCYDGHVDALGISDKEHYADVPQVASRLTYPPAMPPETVARIAGVNAQVIRALGLRTGVTHAEYMVAPDGRVSLVEIAARGGGNRLYTHIVPYLSGVPLPRCYLEHCLGSAAPWPAPQPGRRAAVLEFFSFPAGTVRSVDGVAEASRIPGVADLAIEVAPGDVFRGVDNDRARPGYVVAFGTTRDEALAVARAAKERVRVVVA